MSVSNFISIFAALNDQHRQALIADKPSVKLVKSGDGYTLYNARSDGVKEIKFTPGVEFDEVLAGNKVSILDVNSFELK